MPGPGSSRNDSPNASDPTAASPSLRPLISVDVDDVCFDFPSVYAHWRRSRGLPVVDPAEDHRYRFADRLGITVEQYHLECELLLAQNLDIPPLAGCIEGLATLSAAGLRIHLLSARTREQQSATTAWATRWLPMVEGVTCIGRHGGGSWETKAEACTRLGVAVHLDDSPTHLRRFVDSSTVPVAYGHYPWSVPGPWRHASSWAQVPDEVFAALADLPH